MIGTLAIIPAKAKSERLPSKNMKRVGAPLGGVVRCGGAVLG